MAVFYNPIISTDNILLYFDANNPKSRISSSTLKSMLGSEQITTNATLTDGFLFQNGIKTDQLIVNNFNSYSNLSFVVSIKTNSSSTGTIFSIYGNNNFQYASSTKTTQSPISGNTTAKSNIGISYSYSSSTKTTQSPIGGNTTAKSNVGISYSYSSSTKTTQSPIGSNTTAKSNVGISYSYSSSTKITQSPIGGNTTAKSLEIYYDYPNYDLSAYLDKGTICSRFKNTTYDLNVRGSFTPSFNDTFVFVVKKASLNNITIYCNGRLLASGGNISNLDTFGSKLSLLSRNNQGNITTSSIRLFLVYNKELTSSEAKIISTALRKI